MKTRILITLPLLLLALSAHAQMAKPNPVLTPGFARPLSRAKVCSTAWGRDERHVSQSLKVQVCRAYGITQGCPGKDYEIDHDISRELAGADDAKNLWPQPIAEARLKDRLENALHRDVCAGKISLGEAQREISTDWYAAYRRYFPGPRVIQNPLVDAPKERAGR